MIQLMKRIEDYSNKELRNSKIKSKDYDHETSMRLVDIRSKERCRGIRESSTINFSKNVSKKLGTGNEPMECLERKKYYQMTNKHIWQTYLKNGTPTLMKLFERHHSNQTQEMTVVNNKKQWWQHLSSPNLPPWATTKRKTWNE